MSALSLVTVSEESSPKVLKYLGNSVKVLRGGGMWSHLKGLGGDFFYVRPDMTGCKCVLDGGRLLSGEEFVGLVNKTYSYAMSGNCWSWSYRVHQDRELRPEIELWSVLSWIGFGCRVSEVPTEYFDISSEFELCDVEVFSLLNIYMNRRVWIDNRYRLLCKPIGQQHKLLGDEVSRMTALFGNRHVEYRNGIVSLRR